MGSIDQLHQLRVNGRTTIEATLKDMDGSALTLSGSETVIFNFSLNGGTRSAGTGSKSIVDASKGIVKYEFAVGELSDAGYVDYEFGIDDGSKSYYYERLMRRSVRA